METVLIRHEVDEGSYIQGSTTEETDSDGSSSSFGALKAEVGPEEMESELAGSILARTLEMPETTYGAVMALSVQAAATWDHHDRALKTKAIITTMACLMGIIGEAFILLTTKWYLTRPAVVAARALYNKFHEQYRDSATGVIDVDAFIKDTHLQQKLCQLPLANHYFCFTILAVWSAYVAIEIKEACWLIYSWWHMDRVEKGHPMMRWDADERKFIIQACSKRLKVFVFALVLIPKLLIAMFCWWLGCRWLVATANYQDFILNSVALAFVLDIGTLIYVLIIPRDSALWISSHCFQLPGQVNAPGSLVKTRKARLNTSLLRMCLYWAGAMLVPGVYMLVQQAIPGYKWDVAEACQQYFHLIRKLD